MKSAVDQFRSNLKSVRGLGGLHSALATTTTSALDLSDLLRAELVIAVSAFDHYLHELIRLGVLEIFAGGRGGCVGFGRLRVRMSGVVAGVAAPGTTVWLEEEIREQLAWQSFQKADKVTEAFHYISDLDVWEELAHKLGKPEADLRNQLNLIVDRRNKIAHEADSNPSFPGTRWPIDAPTVNSAVAFLETIGEQIYQLL